MSPARRLLLSLLVTLAVAMVFSWPLPKLITDGVASSSRNVESPPARAMIAGDHLQLLYQFWLFGDMVRGHTPFWHNVYEFNTGDDDERWFPDPYSVPFSLVFAAGEALAGPAFGWNFTSLLSLWLTLWVTWLLTRRYANDEWLAFCCAALAVIFPYRWMTLLGGSPTGFGMVYVPVVLLGLDKAVRDESAAGGSLAGMGILFSYFMDLHCFFFNALITPFWCVIAFAGRNRFGWSDPRAWWRLARALLPVAVGGALALLISQRLHSVYAQTDVVGGRSWVDVRRFSPLPEGLFSHDNLGLSNQVFLGYALPSALLAAELAFFWHAWRRRREPVVLRLLLVLLLLTGLILVVVGLGMGASGPRGGRLMIAARDLIPPYRMIRQSAKAFLLLPSLAAVAAALMLRRERSASPSSGRGLLIRRALATAVLLILLVEFRLQIRPTICLLDHRQGAYEAVANDARARGETPRALALPLWPGDSHWSSIYEYFSSLYRIRMVNGYNPAVSRSYFEDVFQRFERANQGVLGNPELDALQRMKVGYVILHENAFPEKVSPFPVAFTLRSLLQNPRLSLVRQDGAVWAFRIERKGRPAATSGAPAAWATWCPARRWEIERSSPNAVAVPATDAAGGAFARLASGCHWTYRTRGPTLLPEGLHIMARIRGSGELAWTVRTATNAPAREGSITVDSADWTWRMIPIEPAGPFAPLDVNVRTVSGSVDADTAYLGLGEWAMPEIGQEVAIPAALLFHAGYTKAAEGAVVLRHERDPNQAIVYGPLLPVEAGTYEIRMDYHTSAPIDTVLGRLEEDGGSGAVALSVMKAGRPCSGTLRRTSNLPLRIQFTYDRTADVTIERLRIRRID
jgi:hypothetical protein